MRILGIKNPGRPGEGAEFSPDSRTCSDRWRGGGAAGLTRPGGAGGANAGLYDLRPEYGLGSGQCVPGGSGRCAHRRRRGGRNRRLPRHLPRKDLLRLPCPRPQHQNAAGPHRRRQPRREIEEGYVLHRDRDGRFHCNAIAVPDSSVLRDDNNQPFVYLAIGANQFGRRDVDIGQSLEGKTQILRGLSPGERVVGDGSLFLQFANSLQH